MSGGGLVLGIDPGRSKAGFALLKADGGVLASGIEPLEALRGARLADRCRGPGRDDRIGAGDER